MHTGSSIPPYRLDWEKAVVKAQVRNADSMRLLHTECTRFDSLGALLRIRGRLTSLTQTLRLAEDSTTAEPHAK